MPINPKLLAVRLAETVELWGVPDNWSKLAGFYREVLESLPADVAEDVLKRARMKFKWMPKPSELFELATEEINYRHAALRRARLGAKQWRDGEGDRNRREPTPEERAAVAKIVASLPQAQTKRQLPEERRSGFHRRAASSLASFHLPPADEFNDDGTRRE